MDLDAIALKYELTGGFIKNAVLSALLAAVGRDGNDAVVTSADLAQGCLTQMRGALQVRDLLVYRTLTLTLI